MSNPLFVVEATFTIEGRGVALVGITIDQYGLIRVGDRVELKRPDGTTSTHQAVGVEYPPFIKWVGPPPETPRYAVLVNGGISRSEVPDGTEVRLVR